MRLLPLSVAFLSSLALSGTSHGQSLDNFRNPASCTSPSHPYLCPSTGSCFDANQMRNNCSGANVGGSGGGGSELNSVTQQSGGRSSSGDLNRFLDNSCPPSNPYLCPSSAACFDSNQMFQFCPDFQPFSNNACAVLNAALSQLSQANNLLPNARETARRACRQNGEFSPECSNARVIRDDLIRQRANAQQTIDREATNCNLILNSN